MYSISWSLVCLGANKFTHHLAPGKVANPCAISVRAQASMLIHRHHPPLPPGATKKVVHVNVVGIQSDFLKQDLEVLKSPEANNWKYPASKMYRLPQVYKCSSFVTLNREECPTPYLNPPEIDPDGYQKESEEASANWKAIAQNWSKCTSPVPVNLH